MIHCSNILCHLCRLQIPIEPTNDSVQLVNQPAFEKLISILCARWAQYNAAETIDTILQTHVLELLVQLGIK